MNPYKTRAFTKKKMEFYDRLARDARLTGRAPSVGWRILNRISLKNEFSWPSLELIAAELGCNEKTVRRAIEKLEECGWFKIRRGRGEGNPHRYWAIWDNRTDLSTLGQNMVKTGHICPSEPDRCVQKNRTDVSKEPFKESFKESKNGSVPSPKGGDVPFGKEEPMTKDDALLADSSHEADSHCLQGDTDTKVEPHCSMASRSQIFKTGVDADEKRSAEARGKLADSLGWGVVMAAEDVGDENHLSALEVVRREAERLRFKWTPPVPSFRPAKNKPYLDKMDPLPG